MFKGNKFRHYAMVFLCVAVCSLVAYALGVNNNPVRAICLASFIICSIGGIRFMFYYCVTFIIQFIGLLIYSIVSGNYISLVVPLVTLGFMFITWGIQTARYMHGKDTSNGW